jgi:hypothetical protein
MFWQLIIVLSATLIMGCDNQSAVKTNKNSTPNGVSNPVQITFFPLNMEDQAIELTAPQRIQLGGTMRQIMERKKGEDVSEKASVPGVEYGHFRCNGERFLWQHNLLYFYDRSKNVWIVAKSAELGRCWAILDELGGVRDPLDLDRSAWMKVLEGLDRKRAVQ